LEHADRHAMEHINVNAIVKWWDFSENSWFLLHTSKNLKTWSIRGSNTWL
jgi:hypothetical protein